MLGVERLETLRELLEGILLGQVALEIAQVFGDMAPGRLVDYLVRSRALATAAQAGFEEVMHPLRPGGGILLRHIDTQDHEILGQEIGDAKIVDRWHDQSFGEVSTGAENDQSARRSDRRLFSRGGFSAHERILGALL
jgi:hypothetical protein